MCLHCTKTKKKCNVYAETNVQNDAKHTSKRFQIQYPACKACTVWGWETHTEDTNGSWQCFAEHETNDSPWTFGVQYFHAKPIFQDAPLLRGIDFGTAMAILGSKLVIEQTEWI